MLPSQEPKPPSPFEAQAEAASEPVSALICPVDNTFCVPTGGEVSGHLQYVCVSGSKHHYLLIEGVLVPDVLAM